MVMLPLHKGIASLEKWEYEGSLCGDGSPDVCYHILFDDDAVHSDLVDLAAGQSQLGLNYQL